MSNAVVTTFDSLDLTRVEGETQVVHVSRDSWLEVASGFLGQGFNMCVDVTAVDYLTYQGTQRDTPHGVEPQRFEVVAGFISHEYRTRLRARVQIPEQDPQLDSLFEIYPGTDFLEREVYDMFGIEFTGHPDLSRILMPEEWVGHPLRKDFSTGSIPVQFKAPQK